MRTFEVDLGNSTVTIELANEVIDRVNDEWRSKFYNLNSPEEVAIHIAYNMQEHGSKLSQLDGWADLPDMLASIVDVEITEPEPVFTAKEVYI